MSTRDLILFSHPLFAATFSSSLAVDQPPLHLPALTGGHAVWELDEELAKRVPVFIRNALLGQKQTKRVRAGPSSTDAVSVVSHKGKSVCLLAGGAQVASPGVSPLTSSFCFSGRD